MKPVKILFLAVTFALTVTCTAATSEKTTQIRFTEESHSDFKKQSFENCNDVVFIVEYSYDFDYVLKTDVFHVDCVLPLMFSIDELQRFYVETFNSKEIRLFDLVTHPIYNKHICIYRC